MRPGSQRSQHEAERPVREPTFFLEGYDGAPVNAASFTHFTSGRSNRNSETLSLVAMDHSGPVTDAKCVLTNSKGDWALTVPNRVDVLRSDSDLQIQCEKSGYDPVAMTIKATKTQIPRPSFHFAADSESDEDETMITFPQYEPAITVSFGPKQDGAN